MASLGFNSQQVFVVNHSNKMSLQPSAPVIGGFEKDRFLSPEPIDPSMICPICLAVFRPPIVQLACNEQHQFCQVCIEKWFDERSDRTCPCCRCSVASLSSLLVIDQGVLIDVLSSLVLRCRNANDGCCDTYPLLDMISHENECVYLATLCPTPGCNRSMAKKLLDIHLTKDCPRCEACGYSKSTVGSEHEYRDCQQLQKILPFSSVYWKKMTTNHAKRNFSTTPSEVVEILVLNDEANSCIAVCKDGELLTVGGTSSGQCQLKHYGRVKMPVNERSSVINLFHAAVYLAYNSRYMVYFTVTPSWNGIFYAELPQNGGSVDLNCFVNGTPTHEPTSRLFRGLSIVSERCSFLACCNECPNVIGLWSLPKRNGGIGGNDEGGRLMFQVCMPPGLMPECEFAPFKCAVYMLPNLSSTEAAKLACHSLVDYSHINKQVTAATGLIAVSEFDNDKVHLFCLNLNSTPGDEKTSFSCSAVQTIAVRGVSPGYVWRPTSLCFDGGGNLIIIDNGNNRLQIFTASPSISDTTSVPRWQSVWQWTQLDSGTKADDVDEQNNGVSSFESISLRSSSSSVSLSSFSSSPTTGSAPVAAAASPITMSLFRRRLKPHPQWASSVAVKVDKASDPVFIVGFYDNKCVLSFHL